MSKKAEDQPRLPMQPVTHLLKENGVEDWDPRVVYQLLACQYQTTKHLLQTYKYAANQRNGDTITQEDVKLMHAWEPRKSKTYRDDPGKRHEKAMPRFQANVVALPPLAFKQDSVRMQRVKSGELQVEQDNVQRKTTHAGAYNVKQSKKDLSVNMEIG